MMEEWRTVLRHEFAAEEGAFLLGWRCGSGWNRESYNRLFLAMRECCKAHEGKDCIERWIAEGFWYLSGLADREGAKTATMPVNAVANFHHLASWMFVGEARGDDEFELV